MNFLLVNDDGYGAEGIVLVEKILKEYGNVYVVAPKEHQSGKSCSIILSSKYNFEKVDEYHYKVDGVPTSCTIFGLNALGVKIDCVVSGCNAGYNLTIDSMYSGTIGACLESLFSRIPAIAFSCDFNFDFVEAHLKETLDYIFNNNLLSDKYLLNVNFPHTKKCKGIKITKMHQAKVDYKFVVSENEYSYRRSGVFENYEKNTDVYACNKGYISICPQAMTTFNNDVYKELKKKL